MGNKGKKRVTAQARPRVALGSGRLTASEPSFQPPPAATLPLVGKWSAGRSCLVLSLLALSCLLPFSGRAFHVDDTLFVWTAQHITQHPLDPYGFNVSWSSTPERMSDVTKNPPLASYYGALIGKVAGWSERSLHLGFLLPALALVLGTYRLAQRFTRMPFLAAAIALLTPATLISASSVMCDTLMVALWVWAVIWWVRGLEKNKASYLIFAGLLMGACALTKYFGVALIPLLLVYSVQRERRWGSWAQYFLIPVCVLVGYELWTQSLYGRGLIASAAEFAGTNPTHESLSALERIGVALSFLGGSMLPGLPFAFLLWSRKPIIIAALLAGVSGFGMGWVNFGSQAHGILIGFQLALLIGSGISVLGLALGSARKWKDADSVLLSLWVFGTFIFAGFLNWTTNVRSVLPLIPAAAILLAQQLDTRALTCDRRSTWLLAAALIAGAVPAIWAAGGDADLANAGREAANLVHERTAQSRGTVWFEGHWGFQYYMQLLGAIPVDVSKSTFYGDDYIVIPRNSYATADVPEEWIATREVIEIPLPWHVTTMSYTLGAGFYSSIRAPLPFVFGPVSPERYELYRLAEKQNEPGKPTKR